MHYKSGLWATNEELDVELKFRIEQGLGRKGLNKWWLWKGGREMSNSIAQGDTSEALICQQSYPVMETPKTYSDGHWSTAVGDYLSDQESGNS